MRTFLALLFLYCGTSALAAHHVESINVIRVSDGKVLHEKNPQKTLTPASVTKIITTAAILDSFNPNDTLKTPVYYSGKRIKDTITGNIYFKGVGDPFLVSEKLWETAVAVRLMGIKRIKGNLIIDNSLFANDERDRNRMRALKSSSNAYDAPVSALAVNFNTVAIAVAPSFASTQAVVSLDPFDIPSAVIKNKTRTSANGGRGRINVLRRTHGSQTSIDVTGKIGKHEGLKRLYRSVPNHTQISGEIIKSFFSNENITITGSIQENKVPRNAKLLYEINSYPLSKIIRGLNFFSNNYIADSLVKVIGAKASGKKNRVTYRDGIAHIEKFLKTQVGVTDKFSIYNGSGLSPDNKFSAAQVTKVLRHMAQRFDSFPEFSASLAVSGKTGTLEKRFKSKSTSHLIGKIRAKTGTLTKPVSVSSLAGYFRHPTHGLIAFAILQNGEIKKTQPSIASLRNSQEEILKRLFKIK